MTNWYQSQVIGRFHLYPWLTKLGSRAWRLRFRNCKSSWRERIRSWKKIVEVKKNSAGKDVSAIRNEIQYLAALVRSVAQPASQHHGSPISGRMEEKAASQYHGSPISGRMEENTKPPSFRNLTSDFHRFFPAGGIKPGSLHHQDYSWKGWCEDDGVLEQSGSNIDVHKQLAEHLQDQDSFSCEALELQQPAIEKDDEDYVKEVLLNGISLWYWIIGIVLIFQH